MTEGVTLSHTDTWETPRSVRLHSGTVVLVPDYSKTYNVAPGSAGGSKAIARFIPPRLARVVLLWIACALPFVATLRGTDSPLLAPELTPEQLGVAFKRLSASVMGWAMRVSDYRQIIIAVHKRAGLSTTRDEIEDDEADDEADVDQAFGAAQANHGTDVHKRRYGTDAGQVGQLDAFLLAHFYRLSKHHWALLHIADDRPTPPKGPGGSPERGPEPPCKAERSGTPEGVSDVVLHALAKLTTSVNALRDARAAPEPLPLHEWGGVGVLDPRTVAIRDDVRDASRRLYPQSVHAFGGSLPLAAAVQRSLDSPGVLVVVLPTGAGKSSLFYVPALLRPGIVVVIVPLLALKDDIVRRGHGLGLGVVAWSPDATRHALPVDTRLVVAGAEEALTPGFQEFLVDCESRGEGVRRPPPHCAAR